MRMLWRFILAGSAVIILTGSTLSAQSTSSINGGIQFDFSLPGARSLSMGGAFVALADDATAAQANPAGLTILSKPEISLEGRGWNFFSLTPDQGHAFGAPTGIGRDTSAGLLNRTIKDSTASPSFLSFVWPKGRWAFAAYRQQFSNFKNRIESSGPFISLPNGDVDRTNPVTANIDLDIEVYGLSAARRVGRTLAVGGGIGLHRFSLHSRSQSFLLIPHGVIVPAGQRTNFTGLGQQFGAPDFSAPNLFFRQEQDGEDHAWAGTVGITWEPAPKWRVGAVVRQGPTFKYASKFFGGPAHSRVNSALSGVLIDSDDGILFHVPDSYAVGAMVRPRDNFSVSVEYNRVRYSELLNGDGNGRPVDTTGQLESADPAVREVGRRNVAGLALDDSNQFRLGTEWFLPRPALYVRFGTWFDPDHRMRFEDAAVPKSIVNTPRGKDVVHFSTGVGKDLGRLRVDAGVDISPRLNTFSVAGVIYLK